MQGTRLAIGCLIVLAGGCTRGSREAAVPGDQKDSAFAAVQARGTEVMGVDQYTSAHVFEPLPDGGRIVLQREVTDYAGVAVIRAHMADIGRRFAAGDFTLPGVVHAMEVPGTAVMAGKRTVIRYVADTLPRGGQVRIWTTDSVALAAVNEFLAFQRMDHRAAAHESAAPQH
ncbi:MAG TPA: hypothetical protein VFO06_07330 [Gemmatimonadales bacterium]|nr:hypothetical protein [Gemmatimonadales bacterium]